MAGIDRRIISKYLVMKRAQAIKDVRRLSLMTGQDNPCLTRREIYALCGHFGVGSLDQVFERLDVKEAIK